jgi:hypothetical protein
MYSGLTVSLTPGLVSIRLPDDFDFAKFAALSSGRMPDDRS